LFNRLDMFYLSAMYRALLVILILGAASSYAADRAWPVKGQIELSSGFCDFRVGHFHGGIDVRTGGVEGRKVFSPVDGYIWRIRYSYYGYGKALYIKDHNGYLYVFGHLSCLADKLEKWVKAEQYRVKQYCLDRQFNPDSLPVKRGELVAYSGQTGAGPPHFHFEIRDPSNRPLNPLISGFELSDAIAPVIEGVEFIYCDSGSLFPDGSRHHFRPAKWDRKRGKYVLDSVAFIQAPVGFEVKALDKMIPRGRSLNIYKARLFIDNNPYYELVFDKYDYNETRMVDLSYDYSAAVENDDSRYLLYDPEGRDFSGGKSFQPEGGIFAVSSEEDYGLHEARIEVYDASGNSSELDFGFYMASPGDMLHPEQVDDTTFHFHTEAPTNPADIGYVVLYGISGAGGWRRLEAGRVQREDINDFRIALPSGRGKLDAFRMRVVGRSGWIKDDCYIILNSKSSPKYELDYELKDGGILFKIAASGPYAFPPEAGIVYADGYTARIGALPVTPGKFAAFYKNRQISSRIIRLEVFDGMDRISDFKDVALTLIANIGNEKIDAGGGEFTVSFNKESLFSPAYIEVNHLSGWLPGQKDIISPVYSIKPEIMSLVGDIAVSFKTPENEETRNVGLCRMIKRSGWQWTKAEKSDNRQFSKMSQIGAYALLRDTRAPEVSKIYPGDQKTINSSYPEIKCNITDDLSGIEDDGNISISLDGHWLIPEYDPEQAILKTAPDRKLSQGKHQLEIMVSDRAGNSRMIKTAFYVKTK
jgi:hypothetical protein